MITYKKTESPHAAITISTIVPALILKSFVANDFLRTQYLATSLREGLAAIVERLKTEKPSRLWTELNLRSRTIYKQNPDSETCLIVTSTEVLDLLKELAHKYLVNSSLLAHYSVVLQSTPDEKTVFAEAHHPVISDKPTTKPVS